MRPSVTWLLGCVKDAASRHMDTRQSKGCSLLPNESRDEKAGSGREETPHETLGGFEDQT